MASSLRVWKKVECSFTRFERRRAAPSFGGEESRKERGSWDGMVLSSYYFKVKKRPILGRMKSYKFDEVHKPPRLGRFQKRQYSENDARSDAPKTDTFEASETASLYFSGAKFLVDFDAHIRCERATADFWPRG